MTCYTPLHYRFHRRVIPLASEAHYASLQKYAITIYVQQVFVLETFVWLVWLEIISWFLDTFP